MTNDVAIAVPEGDGIGDLVKAYRVLRGMTQEKLGELAKVSAQQICRIESNEFQPHIGTLRKLALALHVPTFVLLPSKW